MGPDRHCSTPWNKNIGKAEQMKMQKYQDLVEQMGKIYQAAAHIAPLVSGTLSRTISRKLCRIAWMIANIIESAQ